MVAAGLYFFCSTGLTGHFYGRVTLEDPACNTGRDDGTNTAPHDTPGRIHELHGIDLFRRESLDQIAVRIRLFLQERQIEEPAVCKCGRITR